MTEFTYYVIIKQEDVTYRLGMTHEERLRVKIREELKISRYRKILRLEIYIKESKLKILPLETST